MNGPGVKPGDVKAIIRIEKLGKLVGLGVPLTKIAPRIGLSRQGLYKFVKKYQLSKFLERCRGPDFDSKARLVEITHIMSQNNRTP